MNRTIRTGILGRDRWDDLFINFVLAGRQISVVEVEVAVTVTGYIGFAERRL